MPIYYVVTFCVLVIETVLFGLLALPLPSRWRLAMLTFTFTSPLMAKVLYTSKLIFGFVFVLFIDTISRLYRIESEFVGDESRLPQDYSFQTNQKAIWFYTQRNLYLTGFTLLLSFILERTSMLLLELLKREKQLEEVRSEKTKALKGQQRLLSSVDEYKNKVEALNSQITELKCDDCDFDTLKTKIMDQSAEYYRLVDEYSRLKKRLAISVGTKKYA